MIIVIDAEIISNMSKKGWHRDDSRNLLAEDYSEAWGGWSEVLIPKGRGDKKRSDQRFLGDSEFVQGIISEVDDLVKKNLRLLGQRIDVTPVIKCLNQCHSGECQNPGNLPGYRIKSGMTSVSYFIARLI